MPWAIAGRLLSRRSCLPGPGTRPGLVPWVNVVRHGTHWALGCPSIHDNEIVSSHGTPYTLNPEPGTLHPQPTPNTLHPTPHTLHLTPCNLHPTPSTPHPTPYTIHPTPYTLHPTPYTLNPKPYTLNQAVVSDAAGNKLFLMTVATGSMQVGTLYRKPSHPKQQCRHLQPQTQRPKTDPLLLYY